MANNLLQMAQAASTNVHNNIDNLILKADLDRFDQTGFMYADKRPAYIGGVDPIVENIAMGPLLTLKSMGSVGRRLLEKTGLRNPVTHYTTGSGATDILKEGLIKGSERAFPGKAFRRESSLSPHGKQYWDLEKSRPLPAKSPAVSVTRDPMFLSRPHSHVGSDIGFIMDRGQLTKQGMKIQPFAEDKFRKVISDGSNIFFKGKPQSKLWWQKQKDLWGKDVIEELTPYGLDVKPARMNPRFEFEERVRGYIPTENIRLIDLIAFPQGKAGKMWPASQMLNQLAKTNTPIIRSSETTDQIRLMDEMFKKYNPQSPILRNKRELQDLIKYSGSTLQENLNRLLEAPTY